MPVPPPVLDALTALQADADALVLARKKSTDSAAALTAAQTQAASDAAAVTSVRAHQDTDLAALKALIDQTYGPGA